MLQGTTPLYLDKENLTNQVVKINMRKENTPDHKTYNKSMLSMKGNNVSTLKEEDEEEEEKI